MYGGLTPAVIASAVSWGGYFFFYENAKQRRLDAMDQSKVHRRKTAPIPYTGRAYDIALPPILTPTYDHLHPDTGTGTGTDRGASWAQRTTCWRLLKEVRSW